MFLYESNIDKVESISAKWIKEDAQPLIDYRVQTIKIWRQCQMLQH
jgi:hypothetical protein